MPDQIYENKALASGVSNSCKQDIDRKMIENNRALSQETTSKYHIMSVTIHICPSNRSKALVEQASPQVLLLTALKDSINL